MPPTMVIVIKFIIVVGFATLIGTGILNIIVIENGISGAIFLGIITGVVGLPALSILQQWVDRDR